MKLFLFFIFCLVFSQAIQNKDHKNSTVTQSKPKMAPQLNLHLFLGRRYVQQNERTQLKNSREPNTTAKAENVVRHVKNFLLLLGVCVNLVGLDFYYNETG